MSKQNQNLLTSFGKVIFATAYVAMVSPMASAFAASGLPTSIEEKLNNTQNTQNFPLVAQDMVDEEANQSTTENLPEAVKASIFKDVTERTNVEMSSLRILKAEKITWSDGCLGLKSNASCTQALVPGWQVIVAGSEQTWAYRTDETGTVAKIDESSSQTLTATMRKIQSTRQQITSRSTIQRRSEVLSARTTSSSSEEVKMGTVQTVAANRTVTVDSKSKKPGFTLGILQPAGNFSEEIIARISVKAKRGKGYAKERFFGDYKYKIKQKAKFAKGLKAGDRIVVRLYDTQNRFLGYSEFECLSANSAVNLVLSAKPNEYKVVRTIYGLDADFDGKVDSGSTTYDYFTQVSNQRVSFISNSREIQVSQFQVQGMSAFASSVYPTSFTKGEYALVQKSMSAFGSNLAAALKATPNQLVPINEVSDDETSAYDVGQMLMAYREVGVANGVQVQFSDVSVNHWAKDFIAELAAMEILEGFPDGNFRPDEQVTRAQFAAMIAQAFTKAKIRNEVKFTDVSQGYWAFNAIREAHQTGFLTTSGTKFQPTAQLSRLETLLAIARGLNYTVTGSTEAILNTYSDATTIRSDVRNAIAALTQRGIIVNYPNVATLNVDKVATRAEVAALIYKALVSTGEATDISSQYAVEQNETQQKIDMSGESQRSDDDEDDDKMSGQGQRSDDNDDDDNKPKRNCNQGIGNGAEGCDPGNSQPRGGSNDEGGRTPGGKK
ncbi:S-layer domain-containing protein [Calothrix sp. NIES-4101]|nr:S-layer domain-containing protein [Calothrix sp. NIES-4101]